jgi:hypothetical protein
MRLVGSAYHIVGAQGMPCRWARETDNAGPFAAQASGFTFEPSVLWKFLPTGCFFVQPR